MNTANLTVAIATLNRPDGLADCLRALLTGEVVPAEVVVVDQSSDSATQEVVERLRDRITSILYTRQGQKGLSASRNAALVTATRPAIAFTDDDCVPDRCWVAALDRALNSAESTEALGGVTGRVLALGPEVQGTYPVSIRTGTSRRDFRGRAIPWLVGTGGNFAAWRDRFERVGLFDERLGAGAPGKAAEDADMFYRFLRAGLLIRYAPDAVVYHARQSETRRFASRWDYGFGIGTLCGIWLQRRDPYMIRILAFWLSSLAGEFAGSLARAKRTEARQRVLSLRGTLSGLANGLQLPDTSTQNPGGLKGLNGNG
jgi:GT2 family glycosyltransferase